MLCIGSHFSAEQLLEKPKKREKITAAQKYFKIGLIMFYSLYFVACRVLNFKLFLVEFFALTK